MDVDNIPKPILDALQGLTYVDDSQIIDLICRKRDLHSELRIINPSAVLTDALSEGSEFLFVVVKQPAEVEVSV